MKSISIITPDNAEQKISIEMVHILKARLLSYTLKDLMQIALSKKTKDSMLCQLHCPPYGSLSQILRRLETVIQFIVPEIWPKTYFECLKLANSKKFFQLLRDLPKVVKDIEKDKTLQKQLEKLACEETIRLGESIHNLEGGCYYSSVIMAASAIEFRLHYHLKRINKKIYAQYFEKATLGTLIQLYDPKHYTSKQFKKMKQFLNPEHLPLIELCNTYRVFSAHSKGKYVDQNIATAILHLSFLFLLDDAMAIKEKKLRECK